MTKLLISVRNATEAEIAVRAGADVVDVKEPARGALGAADASVVLQISRRLNGRAPLSVALGELVDDRLSLEMLDAIGGACYAKVGLAGCAHVDGWHDRWRTLLARLPAQVTPVAVAYADWQVAAAPAPSEVLANAGLLGCGGLLFDTYAKHSGGLLEHLVIDELADLMHMARRDGLVVALAGSLQVEHLSTIARLEPDFVAVRGAACRRGRRGQIDGQRVSRLARLVAQFAVQQTAERKQNDDKLCRTARDETCQ